MTERRSKTKKVNLSALKKKVWALVSIYVRRSNADKEGNVKCYTCDTKKPWKKMQAGHFVPGRGNSILFDLRGIRPQCYACNCLHAGRQLEFLSRLEDDLGRVEAIELKDELMKLSKTPYKFSQEELLSLTEKFTDKIAGLKAN